LEIFSFAKLKIVAIDYDAFWKTQESLGLDEPSLSHKRKTPARFQVDDGACHFPSSSKDEYDACISRLAVATIEDRFNQEGLKMLCNVEQLLLMKACTLGSPELPKGKR